LTPSVLIRITLHTKVFGCGQGGYKKWIYGGYLAKFAKYPMWKLTMHKLKG
jgi:hypothetical protein